MFDAEVVALEYGLARSVVEENLLPIVLHGQLTHRLEIHRKIALRAFDRSGLFQSDWRLPTAAA